MRVSVHKTADVPSAWSHRLLPVSYSFSQCGGPVPLPHRTCSMPSPPPGCGSSPRITSGCKTRRSSVARRPARAMKLKPQSQCAESETKGQSRKKARRSLFDGARAGREDKGRRNDGRGWVFGLGSGCAGVCDIIYVYGSYCMLVPKVSTVATSITQPSTRGIAIRSHEMKSPTWHTSRHRRV